jgi:hypothetical protein
MLPKLAQLPRDRPGGLALGGLALGALAVLLVLIAPAPAAAKEPPITYAVGKGAFDVLGHPVCDVNVPDDETADIQISVQYLV